MAARFNLDLMIELLLSFTCDERTPSLEILTVNWEIVHTFGVTHTTASKWRERALDLGRDRVEKVIGGTGYRVPDLAARADRDARNHAISASPNVFRISSARQKRHLAQLQEENNQ